MKNKEARKEQREYKPYIATSYNIGAETYV